MSAPRTRMALVALATLLLSACSPAPSGATSMTYGLTLAPTGIDPHLNASSELGIPLSSVYDTLVVQNPETGEFVPSLADKWSISPDGRTYTFTLRHGVRFHDGTSFNAAAVAANVNYILDPDHHSQKAIFMLGPLDSVEVIDDYTVALHLKAPFAPLLDSLSQVYLGMASPAALTKWGPSDYQFHQVGTGPYRFVEYVPNDHITLAANPDYAWAPSVYRQTRPGIETITFRFYVDSATRALALENGQVDILGEIPPQDAQRLTKADRFRLYPIPIPGQPLEYFFNTRLSPTDDLKVRQALILGVDRTSIVRTVFGPYSPVAQGPLAANSLGFASEFAFPEYDLAAAEQLLEAAGWMKEPVTGQRSRNGTALNLHIVAPDWGSNPEVAQLIEAAWKSLGAEVSLEIAPGFGQLKSLQQEGKYNAIGLNFFGTDPDQLRPFFAGHGIYNWTGLQDPAIDDLLNQASQLSLDPAARMKSYATLAQKVREDALLLPIRDYVDLVVANSRVQGLRFSAQGWFPFLIDLRLGP
jgi:peptide/nickel transport system substrate-binding protein